MTSRPHSIPDPVLRSGGVDPARDAFEGLDAGTLPRVLPLYETTFIGGVDDDEAARTVGVVLARSLPSSAVVTLVAGDGAVDGRVGSVADLESVAVTTPSWVVVAPADVRVEAIGSLYAADLLHAEAVDTEPLSRRAAALARGTWHHRDEIDGILERTSRGWRLDRMNAVDRNILRLGAYELLFTDLATGIVVDRAVEIAKRFSTDRSGAFVNGVLDTIAEGRGSRGGTVRDP